MEPYHYDPKNYSRPKLIDKALDKLPTPLYNHFIRRYEKAEEELRCQVDAVTKLMKAGADVDRALTSACQVKQIEDFPPITSHPRTIEILGQYLSYQRSPASDTQENNEVLLPDDPEEDAEYDPPLTKDPKLIAQVKEAIAIEAQNWPQVYPPFPDAYISVLLNRPYVTVEFHDEETLTNLRRILNGTRDEYFVFPTEDENNILFRGIIRYVLDLPE